MSDPAVGQTALVSSSTSELDAPDDAEIEALGFQEGSLVVVPILSRNPTFGTGLAIGTGYIFKADELSSNSFFGIGAYGSNNGSSVCLAPKSDRLMS